MKRFGWVLFGMAVGAGAATWAARRNSESRFAQVQQEVRILQARVAQLEQVEVEYRQRLTDEDALFEGLDDELAESQARHAANLNALSPEKRMEYEMQRAVYVARAKRKHGLLDETDSTDDMDMEDNHV